MDHTRAMNDYVMRTYSRTGRLPREDTQGTRRRRSGGKIPQSQRPRTIFPSDADEGRRAARSRAYLPRRQPREVINNLLFEFFSTLEPLSIIYMKRYEDRIVAYIDVLGFKNRIKSTLSKDDKEVEEQTQLIYEAYNSIRDIWDLDSKRIFPIKSGNQNGLQSSRIVSSYL